MLERTHVRKDALTIDVIVCTIGLRQSLMTRIRILSIPGALLEGINVIMRSICL